MVAWRADRRASHISPLGVRPGLPPPDARTGARDRSARPAQVGKTTLLTQVVDQLIRDGVDAKRLFRLQFDDLSNVKRLGTPIAELVDWYAPKFWARR